VGANFGGRVTRDRCYDFEDIFAKNLAKKFANFAQIPDGF
jgi:hypothetical protein